eukprot:RCo045378
MPFGQLIMGPPGSGKTTYCKGMAEFLETSLGRRVAVVNLDPANDSLPYTPAVDIHELVTLEQVMTQEHLGPNGGFVFCMEYLESNLDWLQDQLSALSESYVLIDCPGQIELFTVHPSFRAVVTHLLRKCELSLAAVNLVDCLCVGQAHHFLSAVLVSLTAMLELELPHINVLSKADLLPLYQGSMDFDIEFYTEVQDLGQLAARIRGPAGPRFARLNAAIAEVVEDFGLVSFRPLCISDSQSVAGLVELLDQANGYAMHCGP